MTMQTTRRLAATLLAAAAALAIAGFTALGSVFEYPHTAAALIATGIVIPLGIDVATTTNFVGYVAWCLWLIAMAVALWRTRRDAAKDTDHKGSIWSDAKPSRG